MRLQIGQQCRLLKEAEARPVALELTGVKRSLLYAGASTGDKNARDVTIFGSHILEENAKKGRNTTSERVSEDDDLVPLAVELDQMMHHLVERIEGVRIRYFAVATCSIVPSFMSYVSEAAGNKRASDFSGSCVWECQDPVPAPRRQERWDTNRPVTRPVHRNEQWVDFRFRPNVHRVENVESSEFCGVLDSFLPRGAATPPRAPCRCTPPSQSRANHSIRPRLPLSEAVMMDFMMDFNGGKEVYSQKGGQR